MKPKKHLPRSAQKNGTLRSEEDSFGQELWAACNGQQVFEIVERDGGYFSSRPIYGVYFSEFKDWPPIEQKAMKFVKGRVLDIGCGAGRHSLYLKARGFDVSCIDNSPLAVKVCRLRGLRKVKLVSLEHVNFARAYKTENPLHLEYHKQNRAKGKLSGQSRIRVRHEKTVTRWIEWMILSKEEMKQLLKDTGWKIRRFIEDAGTSYIGIISKTA